MERQTYAGHGKPAEFKYGGNASVPATGGTKVYTWETLKAENPTITGNTKFWAEPVDSPDSEHLRRQVDLLAGANETYKRQLQEAQELAHGFEVQVSDMVEFQSLLERQPVYRLLHLEREEQENIVSMAMAQTVSGTVETTDTETVSFPAEPLDTLLEGLEAAGKTAAEKMEAIRKNRKASYADRLQCKFLEGTAKTAAYVLQEFAKFDR